MGRKVENFRNKQGFIELNKLKRFKESGVVVEGSNAKCWFNVSGERFLFKEYDDILSVLRPPIYSGINTDSKLVLYPVIVIDVVPL